MNEIWKDIKGYEGLYQVSNFGRIKSSYRNGCLVKIQARQHGYKCVQLYKHGIRKRTYSIHRLVAEAFIPNPYNLPEVNHKDEDKANNKADNLEWTTRKDNINYGTAIQRMANKHRNGLKSKPIAQYTMSGELIKVFPSMAQVKRELGYDQSNISNCAKGSPSYSHAYGYVWRYV